MQYSKYTSYQNVIRDETSSVKAVCNEDLKEKYFDEVKVQYYLGVTIVFPILVLTLVVIAVRSCSAQIVAKLKNAQNHPNLAGASLTAIYVMLYVIANDIAALIVYATNMHEYKDLMVQNSFGIFIAAINFALNCFIFVYFLVFFFSYLLVSVCTEVHDAVKRWGQQMKEIHTFQDESTLNLQVMKFYISQSVKERKQLCSSQGIEKQMKEGRVDYPFLENNKMIETGEKMSSLKESLERLGDCDTSFIYKIKEFIQSLDKKEKVLYEDANNNEDNITELNELRDSLVDIEEELRQLCSCEIGRKVAELRDNSKAVVKKLYLGHMLITLYQDVTRLDSNEKYQLQLDAFLDYYQNLDERMIPILSVLLHYHAEKFHGIKVDYKNVYTEVQKLFKEMQNCFVPHQKKLEQLKVRVKRDRSEVHNLKKELEQFIQEGKSFSDQVEKLMLTKLGDLLQSTDSLKKKLTDLNEDEMEQQRRRIEHQVEVPIGRLKKEMLANYPVDQLTDIRATMERKEIPSANVVHKFVIKLGIFLQNLVQYLKPEYEAIFRGEEMELVNLNPSLINFAKDFSELRKQIEIQYCLLPFWKTIECQNKKLKCFVDESEKLKTCTDDFVRLDLLSQFCMQLDHNACKMKELEKEGFVFITDDQDTAYQKKMDGILTSISEEIDKKLRDGVFEVENYLKKSKHLNIIRQSGRDILSQSPKCQLCQRFIYILCCQLCQRFIYILCCRCCCNTLFECFGITLCLCCKCCCKLRQCFICICKCCCNKLFLCFSNCWKRHVNAILNNPWWYGGLLCFRTILGNLKSKPGTSSHFNVWFVASLIVFPLFIITSHTGYILVAWLTEPDKTTSLAFLATGIILFLFIMTRALYMVGKNYNSGLTCRRNACCAVTTRLLCPFIFPILYICSEVPSDSNNLFKHKTSRVPFQRFSMTGLYIAGSCGLVVVGFVALTVSAFIQIPLQTVSLPGYLQNIVQIIFVLIAALVSYKVLNFSETDAAKFLRRFVNQYLNDKDKDKEEVSGASPGHLDHIAIEIETELDGDEYENAGTIAGNVAYSLEHKA